ncbi:MAG TPA: hypothetical protein VKX49_10080 [Bryobacteraceae bacterium]|nr:hypothetical protein [Bryobacteraceae bacterium]
MRFYYLCRKEDVSHTSGTGHVAEVAEFDDGAVVVRWLASRNATGVASTTIFNSLDDLLKVHGHEGRTVAEPIIDGDRIRQLESRVGHLERCLSGAIALLRESHIPVPEDLRTESNSTSSALPVWPTCANE